MNKSYCVLKEVSRKGRRGQQEGARAHEGGTSCLGWAWELVDSYSHMTLPRYLDGDLHGALIMLCPV